MQGAKQPIAKHLKTLTGRVAVVTGASRGAGRAIALVLAEAGATVYVTGRSASAGQTTEGLPGTVENAAEEVTQRGGKGIAARVDHTNEQDVAAFFERVKRESGRLDLLVNNVWGGYEQYDGPDFDLPFWEQPTEKRWQGMYVAGLRAHFLSSRFAAPLLIGRKADAPPGLIVNTVGWAYGEYLRNLYYDVAKSAIIRMSFGMGLELKKHHVAAVALAPGFMRTERVMAEHAKGPFDLSGTESPEYGGRAVAALAGDPRIMERSGKLFTSGDLAREYGFTDVDGKQPEGFRIPPYGEDEAPQSTGT
ncbi:SDR family NAD(P)-dependent oxidoreductase [Myxococcus sp. CA051A]|uniref:SDR family NAD(P)-dependent oxidoreductase n=1 Tax=unclassified Myxococcus TaxID=2648731 RepID=UPI00157A3D59|nr:MULTISPECIES: SDR family NAD(P)-dependent oxidoreductase [unclassified Myxococcus]NTX16511.1 SDR family NAD(P)-dependent oxidoreductase [Myxococcus sp. CA056]NTX38689.1 SDR family NAD(P)-dependent oxidoreductase [Myxococcus sp. CA033]NTX55791.1 SDR family NAD(P)-dependent oxidoreductase [Myxococcus sp. CA039A]NTX62744.1 SDR family NAD(P)-dependent oxidoreductase [Myxococcus sp. CA051A]